MPVRSLAITHLRNLTQVSFHPGPDINLILGPNGSGKTSLLESIHFLGHARAFQGKQTKGLVQDGRDSCVVFAEVSEDIGAPTERIGVKRTQQGEVQAKVNGARVDAIALLAERLPMQVVNPAAFGVLDGGPRNRRQFIDWGVFHVEHGFYQDWIRFNRCLKQRNNLLRHGKIDAAVAEAWDSELVGCADRVSKHRYAYVDRLKPWFNRVLAEFPGFDQIDIDFYRGWDRQKGLGQVFAEALDRDRRQGFTQFGPQRADLRVSHGKRTASEWLSRGQQKLVICAMKIAQGQLFTHVTGRPCIYLFDDLAAELDKKRCQAIWSLLEQMDCQVFVTAVDAEAISVGNSNKELRVFHVEHGQLNERNSI